MDDTLCRQFFVEPKQPLHRRYLALRAFFVDGQSYATIAEQLAVPYHTVRSWVRDFRAQCQAGQTPPFSPSHAWADRSPTTLQGQHLHRRKSLPRLTTGP